jgi:hypothetical protein
MAGEAIARQRRDNDVEGVVRAFSMGGGVRERIDNFELLNDDIVR